MNTPTRTLLLSALLLSSTVLLAQVRVGGKLGANYLAGTQKIQPTPKNVPTNPKGLGMHFGAYLELPFSDLVGIRPELAFSFRRMRTETRVNNSYSNQQVTMNSQQGQVQGALTATEEQLTETDQRLTYFMVNLPLTIKPTEGLRVMVGPSFNFLLGGRQNSDVTYTLKGTFTPQGQQAQNLDVSQFETSKKKGSSATKDFRKTDIMAMAGIGYTLPAGFDMDLRYYRSLSTTYDESQGSMRYRIWSNLVELSLGWTFGG